MQRRRTGDAGIREIFHEVQEKRQILGRHPFLIQGQDVLRLVGLHQVVGILDTFRDALAGKDRANIVGVDEGI